MKRNETRLAAKICILVRQMEEIVPVAFTNDIPFFRLELLLAHNRISLQCPDIPDADSLAAAFGLYAFFLANGKRPELFYCGPRAISKPNLMEMLRLFSIPIQHRPKPDAVQGLLINVGCQYGSAAAAPVQADALAVFDCALPESNAVAIQGDIRPYLTSCSTLIFQLLLKTGFELSESLGTALRFGLYSASNAFSELRFPLDRDMRDEISYNNRVFTSLVRSNLCTHDISLTARALNGIDFHAQDGIVVINVLPCESELLRFIADLALHVHGIDMALVFTETAQRTHFSIRSAQREMQAGRTAAYLTSGGLGTGGGSAEKGGGFISAPHYEKHHGTKPYAEFFRERIQAYEELYDVIDCAGGRLPRLGTLYSYQKRPVTQAYVICTEAVPRRTRLQVRMLEGDITLSVNPQTYLMIGLSGEVYPIEKNVFAHLYQEVDAPPVLSVQYDPAIVDSMERKRIELMAYARGCISKETRVLARQLERGVKIFSLWDTEHYIQGEPGDWLVQRKSDKSDIYIIKKSAFSSLYDRVQQF